MSTCNVGMTVCLRLGFCLLLLTAAALMTRASPASAALVPVDVFAGEPRGPYRTGTVEVSWARESGDEHVTVQLWYPAATSNDSSRAPYVLNPPRYVTADTVQTDRWTHWRAQLDWPDAVSYVRTNSVAAAPLATGTERFPVLIYSHGAGQPQFTATFQTEFLASHGYVVVAIGHAGFDGLPHARGRERPSDEQPPVSLSLREQFEWQWRHGPLSSVGVPEAVDTFRFVLNRLETADGEPGNRLYRRLNLQQVGAFGFSWGGSVSLQAALAEPRVKAVINEDGGPWGLLGENGAVARGLRCPVMIMTNSQDWNLGEGEPGIVKASEHEFRSAMVLHYWTLLRRSSADGYWLRLANSEHLDFSDRPLFEPGQRGDDPEHINPRLAHRIVNQHALEFFDKYLRGRSQTPLLSGSKRYRDAVLLRANAGG